MYALSRLLHIDKNFVQKFCMSTMRAIFQNKAVSFSKNFFSDDFCPVCDSLVNANDRVLQLPRPIRIFFYLLQNRRLPKKIKNTKFEKKKLRFRSRTETFFTQDLVFVGFSAARWCYVISLLLMSLCKIEHLLLVLYNIQKKFTSTSKTVYIYVFCLFLSELIVVKVDQVSVLGNYLQYLFWLIV